MGIEAHGCALLTAVCTYLQYTRMSVLDAFRSGAHHVLVATDVAARGLDIKSIRTVVNFDAARDVDTHIHRYAHMLSWRSNSRLQHNVAKFCMLVVGNM